MDHILTVTLNPALDLATAVDQVVAGPKLRCGPAREDPGGGGVNVARTIGRLGGQAQALVALAGATGQRLKQLIETEGIDVIAVTVSGETRKNLAVTDQQTGAQYRFSLCSDTMTGADGAAILSAIGAAAAPDGLVVLSGGLAPGLDLTFHDQIKAGLAGKTDKLILDTCDPALTHALQGQATPYHVLRIDQAEAAAAADFPIVTLADSLRFASDMRARGIARIVITGRGAEGSVMASPEGQWFCHAPHVVVGSKIGAGDAFVGALSLCLARGQDPVTALQHGVAAAAATVETDGTTPCTPARLQALLPQCRITAL